MERVWVSPVKLSVETTLNDRPLGYVEEDIQTTVITPNSLLFLLLNQLLELYHVIENKDCPARNVQPVQGFLKTALNNVVLPTLFIVVNNIVQLCWAWISLRSGVTMLNNIVNKIEQRGQQNIVQCCFQQAWTGFAILAVNWNGKEMKIASGLMFAFRYTSCKWLLSRLVLQVHMFTVLKLINISNVYKTLCTRSCVFVGY